MLYVHQEFPKFKYHSDRSAVVVENAEEEAALGKGWADAPAAAVAPPQAQREPKAETPEPKAETPEDQPNTPAATLTDREAARKEAKNKAAREKRAAEKKAVEQA